MYARLSKLDPKQFQFLPVYIGPDDNVGVHRSALGPYGDQILTLTQLRERAAREKAEGRTQIAGATSNQDFGYLVDPDGMLVEFNLGPRENFWGHHHYWHEQPLCAVNWYVEHLGMQMPQVRDPTHRTDGAAAAVEPVRRADRRSQLSDLHPLGTAPHSDRQRPLRQRHAGAGTRGSAGSAAAAPATISRSRSRADRWSITSGWRIPDLNPVIAHLKAKGVPILEGPYPFAGTRAVLIEDLDGLALELVEIK